MAGQRLIDDNHRWSSGSVLRAETLAFDQAHPHCLYILRTDSTGIDELGLRCTFISLSLNGDIKAFSLLEWYVRSETHRSHSWYRPDAVAQLLKDVSDRLVLRFGRRNIK